jgi:hypothetical protein
VSTATLFAHLHIRPKYACRVCETITTAPIHPAIIDGRHGGNGLTGLDTDWQIPESPTALIKLIC